MMARSTTRSNQRPDTLMQDRSPPARRNLLATHGRTIHSGQIRKSGRATGKSALPSRTDVTSRACQVQKVPEIGIGGSLAAPPLPHHRTYGSVYGGSRSYANALRSNDSTRVGWAFGLIRRQERFDVFPSRLPGFTLRRR